MKLRIDEIETEGLQTRKALRPQVVKSYARQMAEGVAFDPVVVYSDGERHYLADGFHRLEAMKVRGETEVEAEVRDGGFVDALRHALTANVRHGAVRTHADILNALWMAYQNRGQLFGGEPTVEQLMSACGVSRRTVQRNRAYYMAEVPEVKKSVKTEGASVTPPVAAADGETEGDDLRPANFDVWPLEMKQYYWRRRDEDKMMNGDRTMLAQRYGTFDSGDDAPLLKDRVGQRVPRRMRKFLWDGSLEAYDRAWIHALRAYDWSDCDTTDVLMKPVVEEFQNYLMDNEGCVTPHEALEALVDAFHRHQFRGICPECQGNGCEKCQKKGYLTLADCNRLTEGLEVEETPL